MKGINNMITIEYQNKQQLKNIYQQSIPVGTVFTGIIGMQEGLFLCTSNKAIVSLDNPVNTWGDSASINNARVENYKPVNIKIIVSEIKE
jgi:hypothetical protein